MLRRVQIDFVQHQAIELLLLQLQLWICKEHRIAEVIGAAALRHELACKRQGKQDAKHNFESDPLHGGNMGLFCQKLICFRLEWLVFTDQWRGLGDFLFDGLGIVLLVSEGCGFEWCCVLFHQVS